jgi:hypothetical protein
MGYGYRYLSHDVPVFTQIDQVNPMGACCVSFNLSARLICVRHTTCYLYFINIAKGVQYLFIAEHELLLRVRCHVLSGALWRILATVHVSHDPPVRSITFCCQRTFACFRETYHRICLQLIVIRLPLGCVWIRYLKTELGFLLVRHVGYVKYGTRD